MTFGSSFWKKGSVYPHTLMYFQIYILQWLQKYVIAKAGETRGSRTTLFYKHQWFKSIIFIFLKLQTNQSCFGRIIISCSLFWSSLLFLNTLSATYGHVYLICISSFERTWFLHNLSKILPCLFLLFECKFVWFLLHNWNWQLLGVELNYFGWLLVVFGGWKEKKIKKIDLNKKNLI